MPCSNPSSTMLEQFGADDRRNHPQVSKSYEGRSYHSKPQSAEKAHNSHMHITESMDDLFNFEMPMQFGHDNRNQHKVPKRDGWTLVGDENFDEIQGPGLFSSDFSFHEKQGTRAAGVTPMKTPSRGSTHINFQMPRTSTSCEMKKRSWPFDEELFGPEEAGRSSTMDKINVNTNQNSRIQQDLINHKKGSPWTTEFQNKIKEKSRLCHQALPPNMSPICSPFLKYTSKGNKRKSPSILEFYRYQGGSTKTPKKINDPKRQKRPSLPPASAKKEKTVPNSLPAWTPLDKRARRTLQFSTGGTAGQSKLIWSDNDVKNMNRRFYH